MNVDVTNPKYPLVQVAWNNTSAEIIKHLNLRAFEVDNQDRETPDTDGYAEISCSTSLPSISTSKECIMPFTYVGSTVIYGLKLEKSYKFEVSKVHIYFLFVMYCFN